MPQLGPVEIAVIFVIFFIFFGAGKLGDLGGALRKSFKDFKTNAGWGDQNDQKKRDTPDQQKPTA
jgi:Sec-independent protein translocase protein TatA